MDPDRFLRRLMVLAAFAAILLYALALAALEKRP